MSLGEAMATQRAVRRLKPDPVDDAVVLRCIEMATRAPSGANAQSWEWLLVRDRGTKERLAALYRRSWSVYGRVARVVAGRDRGKRRIIEAVQWQVDHFAEVPVLVVACLRGVRPYVVHWPWAASSHYGSIYPAVQNLLLACRAEGLGAALTTLPLWSATLARRALGLPFGVEPCAVIPVGWPIGRYGPNSRRPVHEVVHLDRYGNHPPARAGVGGGAPAG
ncbi:MAG: nitroreductase family protein [Actinobacteria bacterium]|nr:nitroreductase family protein [Actinomycetota bacterium]